MPEIIHLTKKFDKVLFQDFSYAFEDKGLYIIKGASGKGKTTLLRIMAGLDTDYTGEIKGFSDKKISFLFQDSRLIEFFSLYENMKLVRKDTDEKEIKKILRMLGLSDAKDLFPNELSGGMMHRAAIARSLYYGGDIFLWDEPTKELDRESANSVIDIINELKKEKLVIIVTHDDEFDKLGSLLTI